MNYKERVVDTIDTIKELFINELTESHYPSDISEFTLTCTMNEYLLSLQPNINCWYSKLNGKILLPYHSSWDCSISDNLVITSLQNTVVVLVIDSPDSSFCIGESSGVRSIGDFYVDSTCIFVLSVEAEGAYIVFSDEEIAVPEE